MKLLVTGASGFIGRNALLALPRDWKVTATYHRDAAFAEFLGSRHLDHVVPLRIDLSDAQAVDSLEARFKEYDACLYLAANGDPAYSATAPREDLRANAVAVVNLLHACRFGHFLFFSSGAVYDGLRGAVGPASAVSPVLPYAISKWASERYVLHAQRHRHVGTASIVRFFGAYGPYEAERKIYGRLVRQFAVARDPRFQVRGDGRNLIDAMYVDDTVRAIRLLLERPGDGGTFDLCSGSPFSLTELVRRAAKRFGLEARIEHTGAVPEYIEFRSTDRSLFERFGFQPEIGLEEGLGRFHEWLQKEGSCPKSQTA